jgi:hypothetical protein
MKDFKEFLKANKEKIWRVAETNTVRNEDGQIVISTKEALEDVIPIDWPEDVLSGKRKVIVS